MTDAKKTEVKKTLHQEVATLSEKLQKVIEVDGKAATAKIAESAFKDNLPEGVTPDQVKTLSDYTTTFVAASAHAFGTIATEAAAKHKKLDKVTLEIPVGHKDELTHTYDRVKVVPNRFGNGEPVTKYGAVSTSLKVRAGANGAQLKAARAVLNELAFAALAK